MSIFKNKPFIIAEAGINHNGDILAALRLIDIAVVAGADCIKFQVFRSKDLVAQNAPLAQYQKKHFNNQYEMLLEYELNEDDIKEIILYCKKRNIELLITPFTIEWVNKLYDFGLTMFKISSGSINSVSLLKEIGKTKLPVILSTGMSNISDIYASINILKGNGCKDISILHCVSLYPTPIEKINLFAMHALKNEFNVSVGFSDHTTEIETGGIAVAAGAEILEKHFTLSKKLKGPDHQMSLLPNELKEYIEKARRVSIICGKKNKQPLEEELEMKKIVRTSIVAKRIIKKGEKISEDMLTEKRPGTGISPLYIDSIIGNVINKDIEKDEILSYKDFE